MRQLSNLKRRVFGGEVGQGLVLFAAGAIVILGLVGAVIDAGRILGARTDLQKAADAAALAAAQDLPSVNEALATADAYVSMNASADATHETSFGSVASTNDTVTVSTEQFVSFTFLAILGLEGTTVEATAQATMSEGVVTGYMVGSVAPFSIWGGSREEEVNPGDEEDCGDLWVCVDNSYTFLDAQWMDASGEPTVPDWTASNSNNFKGDLNHGDGSVTLHIGDEWVMQSNGGLGSVEVPSPGDTIVVPIFTASSGNSNLRTFVIGGWAVVEVDPGCRKQHCSGTVISPVTVGHEPPVGWAIGGEEVPPEDLQYWVSQVGLSQ